MKLIVRAFFILLTAMVCAQSGLVYGQSHSEAPSLASLKALRSAWLEQMRNLQRAEEIDLYRGAIRRIQVQIAQKIIRKEFSETFASQTQNCWNHDGIGQVRGIELLAEIPRDKFAEALALYRKEWPHFVNWTNSFAEINFNVSQESKVTQETPSTLQSYVFFELLKEKSALTLIESMHRLLTFFESERLFLILRYDEFQDLSAEVLFALQEIVSLSMAWQDGVWTDLEYLKKLELHLGSEKSRMILKEGLDHLFQVLLFELNFRKSHKQLAQFELLNLGFEPSQVRAIDQKTEIQVAEFKERPICDLARLNLGLDAHFETLISLDSVDLGHFTNQTVLKPWVEFISPNCKMLNKWQTNRNFSCSSDFQEGCNRLFSTVCKSIP